MSSYPPPSVLWERHAPGHLWVCERWRPSPGTVVARLLHNGELVREVACGDLDAFAHVSSMWMTALIADAERPEFP